VQTVSNFGFLGELDESDGEGMEVIIYASSSSLSHRHLIIIISSSSSSHLDLDPSWHQG